ncbi:MAG: hypothetical protein U5R31_04895 [Acidimicrobiia bacterium]|nr:hypothetical protein [Acidimicrobiia bacterium]
MGATVTVEYFDIGEPVDIPVPPPDQVASLDDLLGDLFGDLEGFLDDFDLGEPGAGGPGIEEFFGDLEEGLGEELEEFFGGTLPPPPGDQPGQQTPGAPSPDPPEDGPGTPGSGPPPAEDDRAPTTASTLEI